MSYKIYQGCGNPTSEVLLRIIASVRERSYNVFSTYESRPDFFLRVDFFPIEESNMATKECEHTMDLDTLSFAADCKMEIIDDERMEFVVDVDCVSCGLNGSFKVVVNFNDINW